MAIAEILRVTNSVDDNVRVVLGILDGARRHCFLVIRAVLNVNMDRRERCERRYATDSTQCRGSQTLVTIWRHHCVSGAQFLSQRRCHDQTFESGSLHRTPLQITTLSTVPNTRGPQRGSSRVVSTKNGSQRLLSCGFMGNVRPSFLLLFCHP